MREQVSEEPKDTPLVGKEALNAYLEARGTQGVFQGMVVRQLHVLLSLTDGYDKIHRDPNTLISGPLNTAGRQLINRVTSTPERVEYFMQAVLQSAYRAGTVKRPDLVGFDPSDSAVVEDALQGRDYNPIGSMVISEEEDTKVHQLLIKAFAPSVIDGEFTVI